MGKLIKLALRVIERRTATEIALLFHSRYFPSLSVYLKIADDLPHFEDFFNIKRFCFFWSLTEDLRNWAENVSLKKSFNIISKYHFMEIWKCTTESSYNVQNHVFAEKLVHKDGSLQTNWAALGFSWKRTTFHQNETSAMNNRIWTKLWSIEA